MLTLPIYRPSQQKNSACLGEQVNSQEALSKIYQATSIIISIPPKCKNKPFLTQNMTLWHKGQYTEDTELAFPFSIITEHFTCSISHTLIQLHSLGFMLKVGSFCIVRNVQQNNNKQIQGLTPTKEKKNNILQAKQHVVKGRCGQMDMKKGVAMFVNFSF